MKSNTNELASQYSESQNIEQGSESQNIEFKQLWKDEYIKWISAFANSTGGTLFLLARQGKKWDGVPVPFFGEDDLDPFAFKLFRAKAKE